MTIRVKADLDRIRRELVVLAMTERLWPLEPSDAALQRSLRRRETRLERQLSAGT